jgi:hypothetical protein
MIALERHTGPPYSAEQEGTPLMLQYPVNVTGQENVTGQDIY